MADLDKRKDKQWRYGCVLDAGSSGTRIYIYRWHDHVSQRELATTEQLASLPVIATKKKWTKKIRPGISTFAKKVESVGPDHLEELFVHAREIIPADLIPETPIFLLATAGVRLLPTWERKNLLTEVCNYAIQNTKFLLPDCNLHIQAITGETEGLYGWIAANYLIGSFDSTSKHNHGKNHNTYGFLDMGGASAQIAFVPNATEIEKHADDLKLLRMRKLSGEALEYRVFVTTWLGFGVNEARSRYVKNLLEASGGKDTLELPDPCLHNGLTATVDGQEVDMSDKSAASKTPPATGTSPYLAGTGKFDECQLQVHPLLSDGIPCDSKACLLDSHHFPKADFDINHFLGVSEYWHTTHEVFEMGHDTKAYDLATYSKRVVEYCTTNWADIKEKINDKAWGKKVDVTRAMSICFKASWMINVLHDGLGVPRIGVETSGSGHNGTEDLIEGAKDKGFLDPFQAVDNINDMEVSWTLGKMVLYATSMIPPKLDSESQYPALPVGFGSNTAEVTAEGVQSDFEYAGSQVKTKTSQSATPTYASNPAADASGFVSGVPSSSGSEDVYSTDDSDHWHGSLWNNKNSSRRIPGLVLFLLIFSFVAFLMLGRDRRHRIVRKLNLHRVLGAKGRKRLMGSSSSVAYERLDEDAELGGSVNHPNNFELGEYEEEDPGSSSSSNESVGSRGGTLRRGVSTGNMKSLGVGMTSMGNRISSREHLAISSRSRDVSPSRATAGRRVKSPMPRSDPFA